MPGRATKYEAMAREAADRLERARDTGQQLTFLPDEPGAGPVATTDRDPARPKRGKGKAVNQMREWLAHRGYQVPEEVLAQMAGLASHEDAVLTAMARAERVLAWAFDGNAAGKSPSPEQRMAMFAQVFTVQLRAAEALLPYGATKANPDVSVQQTVQVLVPAAPGAAAQPPMRDVSPSHGRRMAPPPMPEEIKRNQQVKSDDPEASDGKSRTE